MPTKKCFRCGEEKDLEDFYRHPMMADGRVGKCKECNKLDVRENRRLRFEYYQEYERTRNQTEKRKNLRKDKYTTDKQKLAYSRFHHAVERGEITKQPCVVCGEKKVEAHHFDYSSPFEVIWLCPKHHKRLHHSINREEVEGIPTYQEK